MRLDVFPDNLSLLSYRRTPVSSFDSAGCRIKSGMTEFKNSAFSSRIYQCDSVIPAEAGIQFAIGHAQDHAGMTTNLLGGV